MNMEKYNRLINEFSVANCKVKEEDIMMKANRTQKKSWRSLTVIIASIAFVLIGTTVSAATGLIDLSSIFKRVFEDEITQELVDQGAMQQLNILAQKDSYTLTFEGITGDSNTSFGLFKLVDELGQLGNPSLLRINVKIVGMNIVEEERLSEFGYCFNDSFTTLEDEPNTYYLKVRAPAYWTSNPNQDLYVLMDDVTVYYGDLEYHPVVKHQVEKAEKIITIPFHYETSFTPDPSVYPKSNELKIEKTLESDYSEFTLELLDVSKYYSSLIVTFPTNEDITERSDADALWHHIDNDYVYEYIGYFADYDEYDQFVKQNPIDDELAYRWQMNRRLYKTVKDYTLYLEGDIKLFVDGVEVPRHKEQSAAVSAMDSEVNPTYWGFPLKFEPFDLNAAESIEVRYHNQTVVIK